MATPMGYDALFAPAAELQDLTGKWALVTGASSGIGKAAACQLAALKCNVALLARRKDRLEELKGEIEKRCPGVQVKVVAGDVCDDATFVALKEQGILDNTDFLINNAGLARGKDPVESMLMSDVKEMLDANCLGAFRLSREVLPGMVKRGGGHILATGSIAGLESYEGGSVYCASKHALHAFMKAMRYETYKQNIRCTVIAPGLVGEGTEFSEVRFHGDKAKAANVYENLNELRATEVAAQFVWAIRQPPHVNLDLIHVMPVCQGGATRLHRSTM